MKIGVLSDSHDHLPRIREAISIFLQEGVEKIVHCGDIVAPFVARAMTDLKGKNIETVGVFGNNDGERTFMNKILNGIMEIKGDFLELNWNNISIAVYHGTIAPMLKVLIDSQNYDLVLCGHTHQLRVEKIGKTLVVNPGETCGYLGNRATCAIIDLNRTKLIPEAVKIIDLK